MKVQTMASEKLADRLFSLHKAGSAPNSAATVGSLTRYLIDQHFQNV
jgi:hypothetical protein